VLNGFDTRLGRRERQEGQYLSQISPKLLAEVFRCPLDVPGHERVTYSLGMLAKGLFIHE
jgi:hypothetical protein